MRRHFLAVASSTAVLWLGASAVSVTQVQAYDRVKIGTRVVVLR